MTRAQRRPSNSRSSHLDGRQIEVIGRLVEQQDVGRGREHAGDGRAAGLAAGQPHRVLGPVRASCSKR